LLTNIGIEFPFQFESGITTGKYEISGKEKLVLIGFFKEGRKKAFKNQRDFLIIFSAGCQFSQFPQLKMLRIKLVICNKP
jgi:hypothetical protein